MAANDIARIIQFDLVEVQFITSEMHDHAGDADFPDHAQFRHVTAQEISATRNVVHRELGAVTEVLVSLLVPNVSRIMKKGRHDSH